jgi:type IX secretion system PorP/SprF family membrane protein
MKGFRKILVFTITLLAYFVPENTVYAQQDPLYTQYMDNLLVVNPAFAGSKDVGVMLLVSRNQWVSFDGAPVTRSFSYNTPSRNRKIGLGFSVMYDKIGPQKQTGVYFDYSYFLRVGEKYRLSMGLKTGVSFYRTSLTDLITITPDPIFEQDIYENFLPNVGVGFYLYSDDTYFGLSVPKLIENTITREDYETDYVNKEEIHFYLVGGKRFALDDELELKTSAMIQYVQNTPLTIQATAMLGLRQRFWLGGMVRFGDAFGIVTKFQAAPKMLIGYSYDLTVSEINAFSNGTHEIMISYDLDFFKRRSNRQSESESTE